MVNKLCEVNTKKELDRILKGIEPILRNKIRAILLMGGNYDKVRKETEEAIVKHMTSIPLVMKESAQP